MIDGTTAFQLQSSNFFITIQKNIVVGMAKVQTIGFQPKNQPLLPLRLLLVDDADRNGEKRPIIPFFQIVTSLFFLLKFQLVVNIFFAGVIQQHRGIVGDALLFGPHTLDENPPLFQKVSGHFGGQDLLPRSPEAVILPENKAAAPIRTGKVLFALIDRFPTAGADTHVFPLWGKQRPTFLGYL